MNFKIIDINTHSQFKDEMDDMAKLINMLFFGCISLRV